jgi:hypothetical protein
MDKNIRNSIKESEKVLIVTTIYSKNKIDNHTNLIQKELNADICYIQNSKVVDIKQYYDGITDIYDIVIWQNTWVSIATKKNNQKYYYIVHSFANFWNKTAKNIILSNNNKIDAYIFTSDTSKENFEKYIMKQNNFIVIENKIEKIENNKKEIDGLFVSCGAYNKFKNHHVLIENFRQLNKDKYMLEVYGEMSDITYYQTLQKYISDNKLDNVKLFDYREDYVERLKEAEYFILLSDSECCSYAIIEAMMLNKKIICSENCVSFEQIRNYPNKYIYQNRQTVSNWLSISKIDYVIDEYTKNTYKNLMMGTTKVVKDKNLCGDIVNKDIYFKIKDNILELDNNINIKYSEKVKCNLFAVTKNSIKLY